MAVGMLARDVLALTGEPDSDSAYLAGLLHDVGKPVIATVLLELESDKLRKMLLPARLGSTGASVSTSSRRCTAR